jgi:hypothetical protein
MKKVTLLEKKFKNEPLRIPSNLRRMFSDQLRRFSFGLAHLSAHPSNPEAFPRGTPF